MRRIQTSGITEDAEGKQQLSIWSYLQSEITFRAHTDHQLQDSISALHLQLLIVPTTVITINVSLFNITLHYMREGFFTKDQKRCLSTPQREMGGNSSGRFTCRKDLWYQLTKRLGGLGRPSRFYGKEINVSCRYEDSKSGPSSP